MSANIYTIYYLQTNCICFILLAFVHVLSIRSKDRRSTQNMIFQWIIICGMLYCVFDVLAAVFRGTDFAATWYILELSDCAYIAMPVALVLLWNQYVAIRLESIDYRIGPFTKLFMFVLGALAILVMTTPLTGFGFTLDADNVYHRNYGAYVTPLLCYLFLLYISIKIIYTDLTHDKRLIGRSPKMLLLFAIPPMCASVLQLFVYGITVAQAGFTLGTILVYLYEQQNQISKDELTGLNNRNELQQYLESIRGIPEDVLICFIDIDDFKTINDNLGHMEGDRALKRIAKVLITACSHSSYRWFVSRYGSDKFIIIGRNCPEQYLQELQNNILQELHVSNTSVAVTYPLHLSLGTACGQASNFVEVNALLREADENLYQNRHR